MRRTLFVTVVGWIVGVVFGLLLSLLARYLETPSAIVWLGSPIPDYLHAFPLSYYIFFGILLGGGFGAIVGSGIGAASIIARAIRESSQGRRIVE